MAMMRAEQDLKTAEVKDNGVDGEFAKELRRHFANSKMLQYSLKVLGYQLERTEFSKIQDPLVKLANEIANSLPANPSLSEFGYQLFRNYFAILAYSALIALKESDLLNKPKLNREQFGLFIQNLPFSEYRFTKELIDQLFYLATVKGVSNLDHSRYIDLYRNGHLDGGFIIKNRYAS